MCEGVGCFIVLFCVHCRGVMVSNVSRFGLYHGSVVSFSPANIGILAMFVMIINLNH